VEIQLIAYLSWYWDGKNLVNYSVIWKGRAKLEAVLTNSGALLRTDFEGFLESFLEFFVCLITLKHS
jgi:hypothetical protein